MDLILKKENGVVFTPEWVADFMVGEIFKNSYSEHKQKIA